MFDGDVLWIDCALKLTELQWFRPALWIDYALKIYVLLWESFLIGMGRTR